MKTGYKKVSSHGSVNIPVAMRRAMGIEGGDPMEVTSEGGCVVIRPYSPRCHFCGTTENVRTFENKGICNVCMAGIAELAGKEEP